MLVWILEELSVFCLIYYKTTSYLLDSLLQTGLAHFFSVVFMSDPFTSDELTMRKLHKIVDETRVNQLLTAEEQAMRSSNSWSAVFCLVKWLVLSDKGAWLFKKFVDL